MNNEGGGIRSVQKRLIASSLRCTAAPVALPSGHVISWLLVIVQYLVTEADRQVRGIELLKQPVIVSAALRGAAHFPQPYVADENRVIRLQYAIAVDRLAIGRQ